MGMANLGEITRQLMAHGRSPETPAALIRWGARPDQQVLTGTLADIKAKSLDRGCANPAVIVVGRVVSLREKLAWFENKPLFGQKVLVTRSREQASRLAEKIAALGGQPLEFPTIALREPADWAPLDGCIRELERYHWVIFTSVNGVSAFFRRLGRHGKDVRALHRAKIVAIGPKTKEALERYGLLIEYVPEEYRAEAIAAGLRGKIAAGQRVLLPRAAEARRALPDLLEQMGAVITEVAAYRTEPVAGDGTELQDLLRRGEIDLLTFTSSSTVRNFQGLVGEDFFRGLSRPPLVACIGPVTADTAREQGLPVDIQAADYTIEGLVAAILNHVKVLS
jgi:uroporphyrinogen III methyltransferase/synthase